MNIENLNIPDGPLGIILGGSAFIIAVIYYGSKLGIVIHKRVSNHYYKQGVEDGERHKVDQGVQERLQSLADNQDRMEAKIDDMRFSLIPMVARVDQHDSQIRFLYNKLELTPPNQKNGEH